MITKPMLAGTVKDMKTIQYPVLCTPKLDGIRAIKRNGQLVSRNFKPIPNKYTRYQIERYFPDGVDGELMLNDASFQATTSAVMREEGEPKVVYNIFDYVQSSLDQPYEQRCIYLKALETLKIPTSLYNLIIPTKINTEEELLEFEKKCLSEGYEGVMLRSLEGPYKCGRGTVREGYLLKLKRFTDSEATVLGFEERMHNSNVATKDAFGRTERSSKKAGLVPTNTLGALIVKDGDTEFKIGTGFTDLQRKVIWDSREIYLGKLAKYKSQPTGVKQAPRFPVFLGFRSEGDMS